MADRMRVALIGCGNRGQMFGRMARDRDDLLEIVAIAEPNDEWRENERKRNDLPAERAYRSYEEALAPDAPPCDVALVATNDRTHHEATVAALEHGCHVLLEKPVAHDPVLTAHMALLAESKGLQIAVQHELRYAPFFQKLYEVLRSGVLGQVYSYTHTEHVEFWHMTHSFVRGNWRSAREENPMILAKCCHDLDLMPWLLGDRVHKVSSFGRLDHFRPENKPAGAPERCTDGCPVQAECIHDAETFYLGERTDWPVAVVGEDNSMEARRERLAESRYSHCVWGGHNDVVDHQTVMMETEGGAICTLTMHGFSAGEECGRKLRLDGTKGTLRGDMKRGEITVHKHWHGPLGTKSEVETFDLGGRGGHGGGDRILFDHVMECFAGADGDCPLTPIADSVESHLLAWAAEEARLGEKTVHMDEYRERITGAARAMLDGAKAT